MSRLTVLAMLSVAAASVIRHDLTFDMNCYYAEDPTHPEKEDLKLEEGGGKGRSYRGLVSTSESGRTCRNWLESNPWKGRDFVKPTPDLEVKNIMNWGNGLGNHNYCRNPDSSSTKPWCFTGNIQKPFEDCNIPACDKTVSYKTQAKKLAATMKADTSVPDCAAADCLFGSTKTTRDTTVKFLQTTQTRRTKDGKPCSCGD